MPLLDINLMWKMLKSLESRILLVAFVGMVILYITKPESGVKKDLKAKDKQHAHAIDSIKRLQLIQADSTEFFKAVAQRAKEARLIAEQERDRATQEKKAAIRKYESIKFIDLGSDSKRDSVLSKLYPSFRPIR